MLGHVNALGGATGVFAGLAEATGDDGFNPLIETLERRDPPDECDPDQAM